MPAQTIHGLNAVREALASGRSVNRLYLAKESRAKGFKVLVDLAKAQSVPHDFVPQAKLNKLTGTREHQGVAATISPLEYADLKRLIADCPKQAVILVADRVQHARNLGIIIRTAAGAGAHAVLITGKGGALADDTVIRASAGAAFRIPVAQTNKLPEALRNLKSAGFWIFGLDGKAKKKLFDVSWPERAAIVVGNETSGIRPGVRKCCDEMLRVPLADDLDSLNVAVAAGIALFQTVVNKIPRGQEKA